MDQPRTDLAKGAQLGTAVGATSPESSGWDAYYREASLRRRKSGSARRVREEKRRRRWRQRVGMGVSTAFVLALTTVFYVLLR